MTKTTSIDALRSTGRTSPGATEPIFDATPPILDATATTGPSKKKRKKEASLALALAQAQAPAPAPAQASPLAPPDADAMEDDEEDQEEDDLHEILDNGEATITEDELNNALVFLRKGSPFGRKFTASEISTHLKCDESMVAGAMQRKARKSKNEQNARRRSVVRGYASLSRECGYKNATDAKTATHAHAFDVQRPCLPLQDIVRLGTTVVHNPGATSYEADEFAKRLQLIDQTLSQSAAREAAAHIEPVFKQIVEASVRAAVGVQKVSRVRPHHVYQALLPFNGLLGFTGASAPPGLVAYGKHTKIGSGAILLPMKTDKERKKRWATATKSNGKLYNAKVEAMHAVATARKNGDKKRILPISAA
jgi:hypothetical protein